MNTYSATQILLMMEGEQFDLFAEGLDDHPDRKEITSRSDKAYTMGFVEIDETGVYRLTPKGQAYVTSHKD